MEMVNALGVDPTEIEGRPADDVVLDPVAVCRRPYVIGSCLGKLMDISRRVDDPILNFTM